VTPLLAALALACFVDPAFAPAAPPPASPLERRLDSLSAAPFEPFRLRFAPPEEDPPPPALEGDAPTKEKESPWLLAPVLAANPKLGVSGGAIAAFLHHFDEKSLVSMFGVTAQYTSTGSVIAGVFAKTSFAEDHHRLVAALLAGNIKNDYKDFLGTGLPLKSEDRLRGFLSRYLCRIEGPWFGGVQAAFPNFTTFGVEPGDTMVLNTLGLTGFRSGGVGLAGFHDTRDNDTMPTKGWMANLNNLAFRDELSGDFDFDVYRGDLRVFLEQSRGSVLALRQYNQWTVDAPPSALAPVQLRGYKLGQYLGQHMSSIEVEERLKFADRWTATVFAGVATLYGDGLVATGRENLYPAAGAGIQFVLKPDAKIVLDLEYAAGKEGNYGVYLKIGYAF
jgi:hypothetical protein